MAVNDILQFRFYCRLDDQVSVNVSHFKITAEVTGGATVQELATVLGGVMSGPYADVMSSTAQFMGTQCQKVWPLPKGASFSASLLAAGTRSTEPLPPQSCGVVSLKTALAGRKFRGRQYLPFPAENDNGVTHVPLAGYLASANTWMTTLFTLHTTVGATGSTTYKPVIFHRADGSATDIVSGRVREGWGTQRRRSYFGQHNLSPV